MKATVDSATRSGSSPKVPKPRDQRGSLKMSAIGHMKYTDAHGEELFADDVSVFTGRLGASDSGDAGGLGPSGKAFEGLPGEGVAAEAVPGGI